MSTHRMPIGDARSRMPYSRRPRAMVGSPTVPFARHRPVAVERRGAGRRRGVVRFVRRELKRIHANETRKDHSKLAVTLTVETKSLSYMTELVTTDCR